MNLQDLILIAIPILGAAVATVLVFDPIIGLPEPTRWTLALMITVSYAAVIPISPYIWISIAGAGAITVAISAAFLFAQWSRRCPTGRSGSAG